MFLQTVLYFWRSKRLVRRFPRSKYFPFTRNQSGIKCSKNGANAITEPEIKKMGLYSYVNADVRAREKYLPDFDFGYGTAFGVLYSGVTFYCKDIEARMLEFEFSVYFQTFHFAFRCENLQ